MLFLNNDKNGFKGYGAVCACACACPAPAPKEARDSVWTGRRGSPGWSVVIERVVGSFL
ncbi:MAG: hypothetical protein AAGE61_03320 [Pseudomonadota bacterium]